MGESLGGPRGRSVSQDCLLAPRHCLRHLAGIISLHSPCWLAMIAEDGAYTVLHCKQMAESGLELGPPRSNRSAQRGPSVPTVVELRVELTS